MNAIGYLQSARGLFICVTGAIFWTISAASAQELSEQLELITDRPDQTESSAIVPRGYFQIETGVTYSDEGSESRSLEYPGTLLRIGLSQRVELRLGIQGFISEFEGNNTTGFGDSDIGTKIYLMEESGWRPEMALLASLSMPTGKDGISTERMDPSFRFAFSHTLNDRVSLGYNLGAAWETEPTSSGRSTLSWLQYTVTAGFGLSERFGAFVELFGDTPLSADGDTELSFDGGLTFLLRPNVQLDAALGFGLTDDAPDWFLTTGISVRFPR